MEYKTVDEYLATLSPQELELYGDVIAIAREQEEKLDYIKENTPSQDRIRRVMGQFSDGLAKVVSGSAQSAGQLAEVSSQIKETNCQLKEIPHKIEEMNKQARKTTGRLEQIENDMEKTADQIKVLGATKKEVFKKTPLQ